MLAKKIFLAVMISSMALTGFISCSNGSDSDNNNSTNNQNKETEKTTKNAVAASDVYGTYTGTWTVMGQSNQMTVIVAEKTLYCESPKMTLAYDHVWWTKDSDGNNICNGNKITDSTNANYEKASTTVTLTKNGDTKTGKFSVVAMASMSTPADLTYSSANTTVPIAYYVAGTYKGTAKLAAMGSSKDIENSSFVITKTGEDKVSLKVSSMAYSNAMVFPEYTLTDGTVTLNDGTYTIAFADTTTEADANGKTTAVSSITTSVKDKKLTFSASEKYGSMPMAISLTVTEAVKQ